MKSLPQSIMAAPGPHAQDVAFEARLPELRGARAVVLRRARSSTYLGEFAAGA